MVRFVKVQCTLIYVHVHNKCCNSTVGIVSGTSFKVLHLQSAISCELMCVKFQAEKSKTKYHSNNTEEALVHVTRMFKGTVKCILLRYVACVLYRMRERCDCLAVHLMFE